MARVDDPIIRTKRLETRAKKQVKCSECKGPHPASECDSETPDQGFTIVDPSFFKQNKPDMINHPAHYTKGIEVLDYTESWEMGPNDYATTKYITRYRFKYAGNKEKQIEDLNKAIFYIKRQISLIEKDKLVF